MCFSPLKDTLTPSIPHSSTLRLLQWTRPKRHTGRLGTFWVTLINPATCWHPTLETSYSLLADGSQIREGRGYFGTVRVRKHTVWLQVRMILFWITDLDMTGNIMMGLWDSLELISGDSGTLVVAVWRCKTGMLFIDWCTDDDKRITFVGQSLSLWNTFWQHNLTSNTPCTFLTWMQHVKTHSLQQIEIND